MKTIAKHRKGRLEWIIQELTDKDIIQKVRTHKNLMDTFGVEAVPEFILRGKFSVTMNVYDEPTNKLIHTYEVLASEMPCGYAGTSPLPTDIQSDVPIGDLLGSNQYTWFRKETLQLYLE